jgi:hypothetical protein
MPVECHPVLAEEVVARPVGKVDRYERGEMEVECE